MIAYLINSLVYTDPLLLDSIILCYLTKLLDIRNCRDHFGSRASMGLNCFNLPRVCARASPVKHGPLSGNIEFVATVIQGGREAVAHPLEVQNMSLYGDTYPVYFTVYNMHNNSRISLPGNERHLRVHGVAREDGSITWPRASPTGAWRG